MKKASRPFSVVVVTGATAGIGRAIARCFAQEGAHVALLARDEGRLEAARKELEAMGVRALAIRTDVADRQQVEAAADRVEQELGPIDVWVNNAMATVIAPLDDISGEDFQRVTDVTYHGTVWGTMAALKRMKPRNRGTIVQVGSALAYRSIPLQAPYCGAKHAVRGFTQSLRTELIHDGSAIKLAEVEMPGVNTPQFEWCKTTLSGHPQPVGKVFQPEVAARAVVWAAGAGRREVYATLSAALPIWGTKLFPGLLDRYVAHTAYEGQSMKLQMPPDRPDNLWQPVPGDFAARGRFDKKARASSLSLWLNMNRTLVGGAALLALGAAWLAREDPSKSTPRRLVKSRGLRP